ncbi:MAG: alpha/beta fold hydrolase [Chitinophagaceae bacterium]|nr:alpha/beta fold hydrolase [Chitinophagaceae bacterium]
MYKYSFLLVCAWLVNPARVAALAQRIYPGVLLHDSTNCVVIDSVISEGMFFHYGFQKGDCVFAINDEPIHTTKEFRHAMYSIRAKDQVVLDVKMQGKQQIKTLVAQGRKQNPYKKIDVIYGELEEHGCTLRTIEYTPKKGNGLPAILIIPGYNCSSIENFSRSYYRRLIERWVLDGYIVYSVEKSGMGDSEGCTACEEVDLQNDIDIFTSAVRKLKRDLQVDSNRIYLWGHSMGGIIAPIVAQQSRVKGIITYGTVFRPWHQFLLDMHAVQKPLLDKASAEETNLFLDTIKSLYYDFFVNKKTPAELVSIPKYKHLTETELEYKEGNTNMWGRHWRFWQQIDSLDLNKAWRSLHIPVLIIHGGADYIQCSNKEPQLIRDAVNTSDPGYATMLTIPDLDHLCMRSKDYLEAVKNLEEKQFLKGNFHEGMADEILKWLNEQEGIRE